MKYVFAFAVGFTAMALFLQLIKKPKEVIVYKSMNVNNEFYHDDFDSVYTFDGGKCVAYRFKSKHKCNGLSKE